MLRVLIMILGKDLLAVLDERGGWRKFWSLRSHIVEQEADSTVHYTQRMCRPSSPLLASLVR